MSEWIRLTLIFPPHLETPITQALSGDPRMPGFTLLKAEGHTSDFAGASDAELVRGRVERRLLWLLIPAGKKEEVLQLMRTHVDSHDLRWWTEAVLEMGRLE